MTVAVSLVGSLGPKAPHRAHTVTAVIVVYRDVKRLFECLDALREQEPAIRVVVVDNGGSDTLKRRLRESYPEAAYVRPGANLGYAAGNNTGIRAAHTDHVLVLNPDVVPMPGALAELLRVARVHPRSFVTPKLLLPDGTINACGCEMHYTGISTCIGLGAPEGSIRGVTKPLLLSGAAILARRAHWLDVGLFEETFFMYMEDADLSLRARARGYEILCAADAVMIHDYDLNMSPAKLYYLERNRLLTLLRNLDRSMLFRLLPALVLTQLGTLTYALFKGREYVRAGWRAYAYVCTRRVMPPRSRRLLSRLPREMRNELPCKNLLASTQTAAFLTRLTTPVYRLLRPA